MSAVADVSLPADADPAPAALPPWCQVLSNAECYWAVSHAADARKGPAALAYRFEAVLPMDVARLHLTHTRLPGGQILVLGVERERLAALLAERPQLWMIRPPGLPPAIRERLPAGSDETGLCERLNCCHGAFQAPGQRRYQRALIAVIMVLVLAGVAVLEWGIQRRNAVWHAAAEAASARLDAELAQAVAGTAAQGLNPWSQLDVRERRLQALAGDSDAGDMAQHRLPELADALMRAMPPLLRVQIQHIRFTPEQIQLRGLAVDLATAEQLWQALATFALGDEQWQRKPLLPQTRHDGSVEFQIRLVRQQAGGEP